MPRSGELVMRPPPLEVVCRPPGGRVPKLSAGVEVEFHSLKGTSELNGQCATCLDLDESSGRWHVRIGEHRSPAAVPTRDLNTKGLHIEHVRSMYIVCAGDSRSNLLTSDLLACPSHRERVSCAPEVRVCSTTTSRQMQTQRQERR